MKCFIDNKEVAACDTVVLSLPYNEFKYNHVIYKIDKEMK